jgi:hypothetical protein
MVIFGQPLIVSKYVMLDDCYSFFPHLPDLPQHYADEAVKLAEYTTYHVVPVSGIKVNTTQAKTSFENTNFIKNLREKFGHARTHYLRVDGMHSYDWHVDSARCAGIIFLLNDVGNAVTLFKEQIDERNSRIVKVPYTLLQPTLLDVTKSHCVINLSDQPRYALTVGFDLGVSYQQVKEFLTNYSTQQY